MRNGRTAGLTVSTSISFLQCMENHWIRDGDSSMSMIRKKAGHRLLGCNCHQWITCLITARYYKNPPLSRKARFPLARIRFLQLIPQMIFSVWVNLGFIGVKPWKTSLKEKNESQEKFVRTSSHMIPTGSIFRENIIHLLFMLLLFFGNLDSRILG